MRPTGDTSIFGLGGGDAALHALSASPTPSPNAAMPADFRTELIQRHPDAYRPGEGAGVEHSN
jgi:hypothetical protein